MNFKFIEHTVEEELKNEWETKHKTQSERTDSIPLVTICMRRWLIALPQMICFNKTPALIQLRESKQMTPQCFANGNGKNEWMNEYALYRERER